MDEAIRYRDPHAADGERDGAVSCIAGPTCDSADILYEKTDYKLPLNLAIGDKVDYQSTGAYTTTYSLGRVQRLSAAAAIRDLSGAVGASASMTRGPGPPCPSGRHPNRLPSSLKSVKSPHSGSMEPLRGRGRPTDGAG